MPPLLRQMCALSIVFALAFSIDFIFITQSCSILIAKKNDQHIFHVDNKIISQSGPFLVKIGALINIRENSNYDRKKARP